MTLRPEDWSSVALGAPSPTGDQSLQVLVWQLEVGRDEVPSSTSGGGALLTPLPSAHASGSLLHFHSLLGWNPQASAPGCYPAPTFTSRTPSWLLSIPLWQQARWKARPLIGQREKTMPLGLVPCILQMALAPKRSSVGKWEDTRIPTHNRQFIIS